MDFVRFKDGHTEEIIVSNEVSKKPFIIKVATPNGFYMYCQERCDNDIEVLGVKTTITTQNNQMYRYVGGVMISDIFDKRIYADWKLDDSIECFIFNLEN
jgi:hypothetical protein